jgi:phosphotransferase system enzyme I (PtsI)
MGEVLPGNGASPGVACGPARRMVPPPTLPSEMPRFSDAATESAAARRALDLVAGQYEKLAGEATGPAAEVLATQTAMAQDPGLSGAVAEAVATGKPAAWAVTAAVRKFQEALALAGGYFAERASDLDDLAHRVVAVLFDQPMPGLPDATEPYVLVAEDLAPADTAGLDESLVLAIVTERGGPTSHTAILAKAAGLPAVVNCPAAADIADGQILLVNADTGLVEVEPDPEVAQAAVQAHRRRAAAAASLTGPGATADGHPVNLYVNLGQRSGIASASKADSEGVGLYRTEFLFLDRASAPTLDEQREIYTELFAAFAGRTVIVRTLDAGSDKPLAFVTHTDEPNPALGVRGYRTAAELPELLDTQLAALAAAAAESDATVKVMAPMIATPAEAAAFAGAVREHGLPSAGVMIEVPAAALRAERILAEVDFVSIGTNDLSQYTYAADRGLAGLSDLLDPWQPALLELIATTAAAGAKAGKPVGICGEAASDALLSPVLAGLGVTSLSMSPAAVPGVRAALRAHTLESCQELAAQVLAASTPTAARELVGGAIT